MLSMASITWLKAQSNDSIPTVYSHRQVRKITYHAEEYKNVPVKDNYISVFALGTDLVREQFTDKVDMNWGNEKNPYLQATSGFNIYGLYMPRSLRNRRQSGVNFGNFNWGFGLSVNQFRSTNREIVEINTANRDKANVRWSSDNFSFYSIARYEWGWGRFYPFLGIQGGIVYASTHEYVQNYLQLSGYESNSIRHIHGSTTAFIAPEVGFRLRLSSWVSAVVSYELRSGSNILIDDYQSAQYKPLEGQFQMDRKNVSYQTQAWKFGFLFDLSGSKCQREIVRNAYYDTSYIMEEVPRSTPCPACPECPGETQTLKTSPENKDSKKTNLEIKPNQPSTTIPAPVPNKPTPTQRNTTIPKKPLPGIVVPKPTIKS